MRMAFPDVMRMETTTTDIIEVKSFVVNFTFLNVFSIHVPRLLFFVLICIVARVTAFIATISIPIKTILCSFSAEMQIFTNNN
jgi:hypothetical protein